MLAGTLRRTSSIFSSNYLFRKMCASHGFVSKSKTGAVVKSYEDAVKALNSLQSNAAVLSQLRHERGPNAQKNISETTRYLEKLSIDLEDVDKLSIIHVSGTKGKGSTCALTDSILSQHGFRTGFYSSPHLIEVRERIRISGDPLSKEAFCDYFWTVYNRLMDSRESESDMPAYFKFLTVMAFYLFIKEKVDVAIIEVGIGGTYDCTNIIRSPAVVGITSLDLDHTQLLGDTVEAIAWQKAGVMKPGVPAFTVASQPGSSMQVLHRKAVEIGCPLQIAPSLPNYFKNGSGSVSNGHNLGFELCESAQQTNISLALQLAHCWLQVSNKIQDPIPSPTPALSDLLSGPQYASPFRLSTPYLNGIKECSWSGRWQIIRRGKLVFFVDGAHTPSSIAHCAEWFRKRSLQLTSESSVARMLLFNSTGPRDVHLLLNTISSAIHFDCALFCPNLAKPAVGSSSDLANYMVTSTEQLEKCEENSGIWSGLPIDSDHLNEMSNAQKRPTFRFPCIKNALDCLTANSNIENDHPFSMFLSNNVVNVSEIHLLVTGSLHLVGAFLSLLEESDSNER